MIIVKLMGGLGNQMFQYAAARRLAYRHKTELKLDLSFLESSQSGYVHRPYDLCHLNINAAIASHREVAEITGRCNNLLETILVYLRHTTGLARLSRNIYLERHFNFDPKVLDLPDNIYLEGYWQSELYFKDIEETVRNEFSFSFPQSAVCQGVAEDIQSVNAVSLHVRRCDYVMDEKTREKHGVCDLSYYLRAEGRITTILNDPYFFVFSDDPEWVADNMKLRHPVRYVSHNSIAAHEDLYLMSLCRHHIIANSSFSWWGAWLNPRPDKIVIAPSYWFNDPAIDTRDLIPVSWQRITP